MAEKQRTIAKLGEFLVKFVTGFTLVSDAPADNFDGKEDPETGPDDRPLERENADIVSLPHFG
jgi:hypothetical protein